MLTTDYRVQKAKLRTADGNRHSAGRASPPVDRPRVAFTRENA